MNILRKEDLDRLVKLGCCAEGCDHKEDAPMYLHSSCHMGSHLEVGYKDGILHLACGACKKPVVRVAVASNT